MSDSRGDNNDKVTGSEKPHMAYMVGEFVSGYKVYHSAEFRALCERFGIPYGLPTKEITIILTEDEMMVTHKYPGREHADLAREVDVPVVKGPPELRGDGPPTV